MFNSIKIEKMFGLFHFSLCLISIIGMLICLKTTSIKAPLNLGLDYTGGTNFRDDWYVKKDYRAYFLDKLEKTRGIKMSIDAFNGRHSELVGLDLIDKSPEENKSFSESNNKNDKEEIKSKD